MRSYVMSSTLYPTKYTITKQLSLSSQHLIVQPKSQYGKDILLEMKGLFHLGSHMNRMIVFVNC